MEWTRKKPISPFKSGTSREVTMRRAWWSCARQLFLPCGHLVLCAAFSEPVWPSLTPRMPVWELKKVGTQIKTDCATVNGYKNRENLSGQKLSHLFFIRRSLCQTTPNKEGATIIILFLPPRFSQVSARKTRQPEPSRVDPRGTQSHLRTLKTQPGVHFSRFGEVWPSLTKALTRPKARFDWPPSHH